MFRVTLASVVITVLFLTGEIQEREQKRAARGRAKGEHGPGLDSDATPGGSVEPPRPRGGAVPGPDSDLPPHPATPAPEAAAAPAAA